jgi:hypothetical protein
LGDVLSKVLKESASRWHSSAARKPVALIGVGVRYGHGEIVYKGGSPAMSSGRVRRWA